MPIKETIKKRKRELIEAALIIVGAIMFKVIITLISLHGSDSTPTVNVASLPVQSGQVTITMSNRLYHPNIVVVTAGTKITWINHDPMAHTVTQGQGAVPTPHGFNSQLMASGQSWSYVFRTPGTYLYTCELHADMNARVIVKAT